LPLLLTAIVQLKVPLKLTFPLTLFVLVAVRSAICRVIVLLTVFDVTPFTVAEAVLVTEPAVISTPVTV